MAEFEDFKEGEHVAHITIGDGIVTRVTGAYVRVHYDRGVMGVYERGWFKQYPTYLFHRSNPAPVNIHQRGGEK